jgi:hypothetical protein
MTGLKHYVNKPREYSVLLVSTDINEVIEGRPRRAFCIGMRKALQRSMVTLENEKSCLTCYLYLFGISRRYLST